MRTNDLWPLLLSFWAAPAFADDVLTQHNDNGRTGVYDDERVLTTANVAPGAFGRLWNLYADGQIVAQPLYVSGLEVDTPTAKGKFNAVIVATMHNTIYVYDADRENPYPDGKNKPLWAKWLGPGRTSDKTIDMWSTNDPEWGILSTPVVDPGKNTLWVIAWHFEDGANKYRLHAFNLHTGDELGESTLVGGQPPDPKQPCKYEGGYNPCKQKQRSALLLDRGVIYAGFGGDGSRGCVFAFDAKTLKQAGFWSVTPKGANGGIWQSGQGPSADADGNVYFITGNGTLDAPSGGKNYGNSFVRLRLEDGVLEPKDYFAPCNSTFLNSIDLDLGSGGPVLIPNSDLVFGAGKEGVLYLLSRKKLGGHRAGFDRDCQNPNALQEFYATDLHQMGAGTVYGHVHGSPVFWVAPDYSRMFIWGENDYLKAYTYRNGLFVDINKPRTSIYKPPDGMPGGMLALSSNQNKPGSAIVWATVPIDGDTNKSRGVRGLVMAVDARDVSRQLWSSELTGVRDRLGLFARFVPPTVAGGKVFVATYGNAEQLRTYYGDSHPPAYPQRYYLAVYGQLAKVQPKKPVKDESDIDLTVLKARAAEPLKLDLNACIPVEGGQLNCTNALEQKYGAPSIHSVIVPRSYTFPKCQVLRVTVASRGDALIASSGIGWFAADATDGDQAMTAGRYITQNRLKQIGTGTLTAQLGNGVMAVLHEFVGVVSCDAGGGDSFDKLFKPYMQFDNAPDVTYRKWDFAPHTANQNYLIGRRQPQIDFTDKVLKL